MSATTNSLVARAKRFAVPLGAVATLMLGVVFVFDHSVAHAASGAGIVAAAPMDDNSVSSLVALDNAVEAVAARARHFRHHLTAIGREGTLKQTTAAGDARRLAAEAIAEGFEAIVAAGGDGTLNEVLNGMGDVPDGFERARLGVLPLGTVNVFARELAIPTKLETAWAVIRQGRETRIDLPRAEYHADGPPGRRYFAQMAGAGLDARAVEQVQWQLKKRIGQLAYVVAGLKALLGVQSKITAAGGGHSATGELVLFGNGRLYGGQFRLFPNADMRDGRLDVCVFPRINWLTLARCAPSLLLRGTLPASAVEAFQAESFTLASPTPTPFELDGELIGHLPATFSVERSRLRVIVP